MARPGPAGDGKADLAQEKNSLTAIFFLHPPRHLCIFALFRGRTTLVEIGDAERPAGAPGSLPIVTAHAPGATVARLTARGGRQPREVEGNTVADLLILLF